MTFFKSLEQGVNKFSLFGDLIASRIPLKKREDARNILAAISVTTLATAKLLSGNWYSLIPFGIGVVSGLVSYKLYHMVKLDEKNQIPRVGSLRALSPSASSGLEPARFGSLSPLARERKG
ncbi:MAG TPA: hypothetical protein VLG44_04600 [Chlamydiales bacterium]|nr:hypothetical protein [Chlamydiales bacterium]